MAIFVDRVRDYFLLTNFKVMYSTLLAQNNLQEIFLVNYLDYVRFKSQQSQKKTIMLVRNPYSKLISFFEDKFRRYPNLSSTLRAKYTSNSDGWQNCQKIFFPHLKIGFQATDREISHRLYSTSFEEFITYLSIVYQQDEHLLPQIRIIDFVMFIQSLNNNSSIGQPIKIKLNLDRIIKFEHLEQDYIKRELNIDLNIVHNKNHSPQPWENYYSSSTILATVNRLYQDDFERFNYPQHQKLEQLVKAQSLT